MDTPKHIKDGSQPVPYETAPVKAWYDNIRTILEYCRKNGIFQVRSYAATYACACACGSCLVTVSNDLVSNWTGNHSLHAREENPVCDD